MKQNLKLKIIYLYLLLSFSFMANAQSDFKAEQQKFERVSNAYNLKWQNLKTDLKAANIGHDFDLVINAYKAEGKLEIWIKNKTAKSYKLFKTYNFCQHSGKLGPKVMEGDRQTPEGFYYINVFNPLSSFHLSLGVNYPNEVDQVRTGKDRKTGGDIYIHGDCVTVGCIPLTDDKIREVYVLAIEAKNSGQNKIPVQIFPFKMDEANLTQFGKAFPEQKAFWNSIKPGFDYFEKYKSPIKFTEQKGEYIFQ